ncbi:MAG: hypothetical protein KKA19_04675 [Candidatus Margulisbacteria bacterium]|nr:hypothetical protein [Candidatus Margulisiibacteriota bacterium]
MFNKIIIAQKTYIYHKDYIYSSLLKPSDSEKTEILSACTKLTTYDELYSKLSRKNPKLINNLDYLVNGNFIRPIYSESLIEEQGIWLYIKNELQALNKCIEDLSLGYYVQKFDEETILDLVNIVDKILKCSPDKESLKKAIADVQYALQIAQIYQYINKKPYPNLEILHQKWNNIKETCLNWNVSFAEVDLLTPLEKTKKVYTDIKNRYIYIGEPGSTHKILIAGSKIPLSIPAKLNASNLSEILEYILPQTKQIIIDLHNFQTRILKKQKQFDQDLISKETLTYEKLFFAKDFIPTILTLTNSIIFTFKISYNLLKIYPIAETVVYICDLYQNYFKSDSKFKYSDIHFLYRNETKRKNEYLSPKEVKDTILGIWREQKLI